ncbi:Synergin gamma [Taenia crassiceps]|uniref:Synergin gamma n=1 Tax=Taenia crassiceps TaxID=6207 RepID=A0ABR4QG89_9CEST
MEVRQQDDQILSIDDFISKMLVSKDGLAQKSSFSPNFPQKSPVLETQHPSFNPSFPSPKLEPGSASDDAWENFKSSFDTQSFMQPKTTKGDNFFNFDAEFGDFALRESINHSSSPNLNLAPVLDFSSRSSSSFPVGTVASNFSTSHPNQTFDPSGSFEEFSDFVGSGPSSTLSVAKQSPLTPHVTKAAENTDSSTVSLPQKEQLASESTPQEIGPEDGFEDFQACAYESPSTVEQTPKQLPTEEWLKCLSECRSMLSESASILSSLATDSDVDAFLATSRGNEFILELIEIYGIIQRIRLAASLNDLLNSQLQAVFNQIDRVWGDLARFVKNQDHKLTLKRRLVQSVEAATMVNSLSVEPNCGVCVTPVPASSSSPSPVEVDPGTAVISLAGRVYHASCANLWVNRIELSLPALRVR